VKLGVYGVGWRTLYSWVEAAASFAVTAPEISPASPVHVQGNRLVNAAGQPVHLHGVNRSGTEYMCLGGYFIFDGPSDSASIAAIKSWRANAVRIPLNEDCWLGINGVPAGTTGATYQQAIKDYVSLLNQYGLYAILDLHFTAPGTQQATQQMSMPDMDHTPAFWSSVANAFKGNNAVIFEPFNEPWPGIDPMADTAANWTCWRDGGTCAGISYQVAGMQTLVNSIRATGATNVIAQGGLRWSNLVTQWLTYKPSDPLNNLAVAWHVYNFTACNNVACYDSQIAPVAAQLPVITTEAGDDSCNAAFINTLTSWLDAHQTGYLAWVWDVWGVRFNGDPNACGSIALITDYAGTPTTYGQTYRAHLAGLP
jgi:hypothetical protein